VQSQRYRDQAWYLLINNTNGNHFRINDVAYQFLGRCDGNYTVQQIWDTLLEKLGDAAPTQDELIRLLSELDERDLIRYEMLPDIPRMFRQQLKKDKSKRLAFINPFAFKLPLWNPTQLLDSLSWLQKPIFNPITFFIWLAIVVAASLSAASHWSELQQHVASNMATPHYLFLAWLSFPLIKFIHELGHGLAVRHWDGQVKETGITFFTLTPAPYVDASASTAFRSRYQRIIVGAVGMMVELLLASIALLIWFSTQNGLIHDLAFVTIFICSVSSVLFNGNPLLRFDAYHILCDMFDLPNLGARSKTYWTNLIKRLALGKDNANPMLYASGERKWLIAYAPLSTLYSLFLVSYIVIWVGSKSAMLGLLIALLALFSMVIKPLFNVSKNIIVASPAGTQKRRSFMFIGAAAISAFILFCLVPVPYSTLAQGVVWLPEEARIRPSTEGFIKTIVANHGDIVKANQLIMILDDPALMTERDNLNQKLSELQTDQYKQSFQDPVQAANVGEQMNKVHAELAEIEDRIKGLEVRSQVKGNLVLPHQNDLPGTFVKKGLVLGYVLDKDIIKVRAVVPEPSAALVRDQLSSVEVRTADHVDQVYNANMVADTPSVTRTLPSAALGDRGGGRYVTDAKDEKGLTSVEPLVLIDLNLPSTELERVGTRASVRFNHGTKPIAAQVYRQIQQLFLRYFNPTD
jgi:putative peptide zinc metalloprotease protein